MRQRLRIALLIGAGLLAAGCHLVMGSSGGEHDAGSGGSGAQSCGAVTCGDGQVCCNASCGICTNPEMVCIQIACDPATVGKTCADLHCAASETCTETRTGPQCIPAAENPCNLVDCQDHHRCDVVAGAAVCVDTRDAGVASDGGAKPIAPGLDASVPSVDAGAPTSDASSPVPVVDTGVPPQDTGTPPKDTGVIVVPPAECALVLCPAGTYCDDISGAAKCIKLPSCNTVKCSSGQHCELVEVQCIRAPCPPLPMCIDDADDPCANIKCAEGTHCEPTTPIACFTAPCKVAPALCVPDDAGGGGSCGGQHCGAGTFCCNAGCGICAPKKGACLDIICEPGPYTEEI